MDGQKRPETEHALPVPCAPASSPQPGFARIRPEATFLSQLIAARDHLPPQRARRQAPADTATSAYASRRSATERRMPAGYNRTVIA